MQLDFLNQWNSDKRYSVETVAPVTVAILAGGLGTRLRSVVSDMPKVLAPVLGRPFLYYILNSLVCIAPRRIVILTGYLGNIIEHEIGCEFAGIPVVYSRENTPLGTAGAIRAALGFIETDFLLLLNGDSYCTIDYLQFLDSYQRSNAAMSMALTWTDDTSRFGSVERHAEGRISRFLEKHAVCGTGWINAGVYLLHRLLIQSIPKSRNLSLEHDCIPEWIKKTEVVGFPCPGALLDIGTPESYEAAAAYFRSLKPIYLPSCLE